MLKQFKYTDLQACHNTNSILQKMAECCCKTEMMISETRPLIVSEAAKVRGGKFSRIR